mgnify:CR=1 FL=1
MAIHRANEPPLALRAAASCRRCATTVICRHCGAEIADRAIVCYRCGAATTEPVRRPPAPRRRVGWLTSVLALALLLFVALYVGQAGTLDLPRPIAWTVAGLALLLLVVRRLQR